MRSITASLVFILVFVVSVLGQSAKDSANLEKEISKKSDEVFSLWQIQDYAGALKILQGLYRTPGVAAYEDEWIDILYNLTCAHTLNHNYDSALFYLTKAVDAGFMNYDQLMRDSDLDSIRTTKEFNQILDRALRASKFWKAPAFSTEYREDLPEDEKLAGLARFWMEVKLNFVFFDQVPGLDWDSLYMAFIPLVKETNSTLEYLRVLQKMCSYLNDGHTGITGPRQLWPSVWSNPGVSTGLVEDKVVITDVTNDSLRQTGIHEGMEITKINGLPAKEYAERFVRPYMRASSPQGFDVQTYAYYLLSGKDGEPVELSLVDGNGKNTDVTLLRKYGFPDNPAAEFSMLDGNIAYFNIRSFSDNSVNTKFDSLFDTIKDSKGLIIDLRTNGGGSSGVGYGILDHLTDTTFATFKVAVRLYSPQKRQQGRAESWETNSVDYPPNGLDLFKGPVAVLAGAKSASAAEDFLVAFDYMNRGPIIGEPSFGSTGQPLTFGLPGGILGRVCMKRCSYPDGREFIGVGVQPDILVRQTVADLRNNRDAALEKAEAYIRDYDKSGNTR